MIEEKDEHGLKSEVDDKTFLAAQVAVNEEFAKSWLRPLEGDSGSKQGSSSDRDINEKNMIADDTVMLRLQESFSATNKLMMEVKKVGQEFMAATQITESGVDVVRKGFKLCKGLTDCAGAIELALLKPRHSIMWQEAVTAMQHAAGPFVELEKFHQELMGLYNVYVPRKRTVKA